MEKSVPGILVVGPMKAGTSWVHDYLASREDVCLPELVKETFFFDRYFAKGLDWYRSHFSERSASRLVAEVGPSYFHCTKAPSRIRETLGALQVIVILRDPVKRSWSHYLHLCRKGYTNLPFRQAVVEFPEILDASRYTTTLERWIDVLGEQNVSLMRFDDLVKTPDFFAERLCAVMGLEYQSIGQSSRGKSNESGVAPSFRLAWLGRKVASGLRGAGLYTVVNLAKNIGLKTIFFGRPDSSSVPKLSDSDKQWLTEQLAADIKRFDELTVVAPLSTTS